MINAIKLPEDFGNTPKKDLKIPENFTGLLLHCCCAPCSGALFECIKSNGITPTVFFYNPNIHPKEEYEKRRDELIELAKLLNFKVHVGDYDTKSWFEKIKGLEQEPERGKRCAVCFTHRLTVAAMFAKELGLSHFTSSLATSRWKKKEQVDQAGFSAQEATGVMYWDQDWRKQGLVNRRYELVKKFNFYNQEYCGCVYSQRSSEYEK